MHPALQLALADFRREIAILKVSFDGRVCPDLVGMPATQLATSTHARGVLCLSFFLGVPAAVEVAAAPTRRRIHLPCLWPLLFPAGVP